MKRRERVERTGVERRGRLNSGRAGRAVSSSRGVQPTVWLAGDGGTRQRTFTCFLIVRLITNLTSRPRAIPTEALSPATAAAAAATEPATAAPLPLPTAGDPRPLIGATGPLMGARARAAETKFSGRGGGSCCWQDEEEAVGGSPPWLRGRKADERLVTATAGDGPEWPPTAGEEGCSLAMGLGGFFHRRAVGNDDGFGVGRGRWEAFIQQRTDEDSFGQGGADSQLVAASRAGDASRERCSSNNAS
ncbi:unnamed protein product [Lampetra fluviatilis]